MAVPLMMLGADHSDPVSNTIILRDGHPTWLLLRRRLITASRTRGLGPHWCVAWHVNRSALSACRDAAGTNEGPLTSALEPRVVARRSRYPGVPSSDGWRNRR